MGRTTRRRRERAWRAAALAMLISLASCSPSGCSTEDPPPRSDELLAQRFPRSLLPFPVRVRDPGVPDSSTITGRRIHMTASGGSAATYVEWQGARTAVIALDDLVAVVFPPADRVGLDLAYGGLDVPWTRVPLSDTPVQNVGDIEAVRDAQGTAWIAVREKNGGQPIRLYRWRPGEAISSEEIPRVAPVSAMWFHDTCEDLALAVRSSGDIDLFYQQVYSGGPSNALMHAHRAAGSAAWTTTVVAFGDDAQFGTIAANRFGVLGCRTVVEHDIDESLHVASLHQAIDRLALVAGQINPMPIPPAQIVGFYQGPDGRWRRAQPSALLGDGTAVRAGPFVWNGEPWHDTWPAQFDLGRHPEGFVLAAPSHPLSDANVEDFQVFGTSMHYDFDHPDAWQDLTFVWGESRAQREQMRSGGELLADECGAVYLMHEYVNTETHFLERFFPLNGSTGCPIQRAAPVFPADELPQWFPMFAHPTHARGLRPYNVSVCLVGQDRDQLALCDGTGGGGGVPLERLASIVATDLPATPALTGTTPITVTMSRAAAADETPAAQLVDVTSGLSVAISVAPGSSPDQLVITPGDPWRGRMYRLTAWFDSPDGTPHASWLYTGVERPIITFRNTPGPIIPDVRTTQRRFPCEALVGQRDRNGTCTYSEVMSVQAGQGLRVWLPHDPASLVNPPWLERPNGTVVPTTYGPHALLEGTWLTWNATLDGNTAHTYWFPGSITTGVGGPIHPDDMRFTFVTGPPVPYLVSSVPASGATGVATTAAIDLTFNIAVTIPVGAVTLVDSMGSVPLTMQQLSPTQFRFTHAGLAPSTVHTLILDSAIVDGDSQPLAGAPLQISFQTGPS